MRSEITAFGFITQKANRVSPETEVSESASFDSADAPSTRSRDTFPALPIGLTGTNRREQHTPLKRTAAAGRHINWLRPVASKDI